MRPARAHTATTLTPRRACAPRRTTRVAASPPPQRCRSHRTTAAAGTPHCAARAPRPPALRRRQRQRLQRQTSRTNDDERQRKDAAFPKGHNAEDADRWGTATLGRRLATGSPLCSSHASVAHTATRPRHKAPPQPCALTTKIIIIAHSAHKERTRRRNERGRG